MLILTRNEGEVLRIGDDIILTVTSVLGPQVRIGIKAPADVEVLRGELAEGQHEEAASPVSGARPEHAPRIQYRRRRPR